MLGQIPTGIDAVVVGNVAQDVEMRFTPTGKAVASFGLGCYGYEKYKTIWVQCTVWEGLAEAINKLTLKGCKVRVKGMYFEEEYKNKAGETKFQRRCNVSSFEYGHKEDSDFKKVEAEEKADEKQESKVKKGKNNDKVVEAEALAVL